MKKRKVYNFDYELVIQLFLNRCSEEIKPLSNSLGLKCEKDINARN